MNTTEKEAGVTASKNEIYLTKVSSKGEEKLGIDFDFYNVLAFTSQLSKELDIARFTISALKATKCIVLNGLHLEASFFILYCGKNKRKIEPVKMVIPFNTLSRKTYIFYN